MTAEKVRILAKARYLSELTEQELTEVSVDFSWQEFTQGTDIIVQGQMLTQFFVLAEGRVEVLFGPQGNDQTVIRTFGPGDAFGARSLLIGGGAPFTVRCAENCKVLAINAEQFTNMLERWPKLYKKFVERFSQDLDKVNIGLWEARQKEFLHSLLQQTKYENKFYGLWGSSKTTKLMETKIAELAQIKGHLLLLGERGTGRQMMAWHIHKRKFGEAAPFVTVNGRDFDKQWVERISRNGIQNASFLEYVSGGTLFIDEIDWLSPNTQRELAVALSASKSNCFIIGSLQQAPEAIEQLIVPDLRKLFTDSFRITSLRDRKRDIPFIAQGILERLAKQHNRKTPSLDHEATKLLLSHNYRQGNVTELIQVVERAFFLAEYDQIGLEHVFFGPTAKKVGGTFDLLSFHWVEKLFRKGLFVLSLQRITAVIFISIIVAMFIVPQLTINIGLFALVWGLWWPALAMLSPLLGRVWCTVCPFSYVMELTQRKMHFNRSVPDWIKKYDYLLITFLFVLIFWVEAIFYMRANPIYTGLLLLTILGGAVLVGIIYTRHTWCHHLCPLGGFVGMASIGALLEVRADANVCLNKCTTYDCYKGNPEVAGCPMSQHAPFVDNSLVCKMCFNCVRNCNNGAVKFNLRIPAREVWHLLRVNQGFVIFIGVSIAILFPINYFEALRHLWPTEKWVLWFSLYYWGSAVTAGLLTWLVAQPFKTKAATRRIKLVFSFIPFVIAGHIIYQLHFLPGADQIMLGLDYKTALGEMRGFSISATRLAQFGAFLIGITLTGFTFLMVMLRSNGKPETSGTHGTTIASQKAAL